MYNPNNFEVRIGAKFIIRAMHVTDLLCEISSFTHHAVAIRLPQVSSFTIHLSAHRRASSNEPSYDCRWVRDAASGLRMLAGKEEPFINPLELSKSFFQVRHRFILVRHVPSN